MRLFTAVEIDSGARHQIAEVQRRLAEGLPVEERVKWVHLDLLHITLVFIGEVERDRVPRFIDVMNDVMNEVEHRPFGIVLGGVGVFPPRGPARVLTLGVRDGARQIGELHDLMAHRLEAVGVARETRPFHPHVTLARWPREPREKRPHRAPRSSRDPWVRTSDQDVARVQVTDITLFESRLSSGGEQGGGRYIPLARAHLT